MPLVRGRLLSRLFLVVAALPRTLPPHRLALRAWHENVVHAYHYVRIPRFMEDLSSPEMLAVAANYRRCTVLGVRTRAVAPSADAHRGPRRLHDSAFTLVGVHDVTLRVASSWLHLDSGNL